MSGDGKFVTVDDVTGRYEGEFPAERLDWVALRIADVEAELMGQVPSLRKPRDVIDAESAAAGDPGRLDRVKTLVCSKVLELFRNPDGAAQISRTMPDLSSSRAYGYFRDETRGRVAFIATELDSVRLHARRLKFGTITIGSWSTGGHHGRTY